MSLSPSTVSDVDEAEEDDTVAVGSVPADATVETRTCEQHPTSWDDAVNRWAKAQGDALKPCKVSLCWDSCFYARQVANAGEKKKWPDMLSKGPWCYIRPGDRCEGVLPGEGEVVPPGEEAAAPESVDDEEGGDVDSPSSSSSSSSLESEEADEDEEDVDRRSRCKVCCKEGSWCGEIHARFAQSLCTQRRKIMREFRNFHARLPKGARGVIAMSSALNGSARKGNQSYLELYGAGTKSKDTEARAVRHPVLALLLRIRARTDRTATSTASTVALLAGHLEHAHALHATQVMKVITAILRARAPPPLTRARTDQTATSTASTVALLAGHLEHARALHATQVMKE